jgi:hypothetical protein
MNRQTVWTDDIGRIVDTPGERIQDVLAPLAHRACGANLPDSMLDIASRLCDSSIEGRPLELHVAVRPLTIDEAALFRTGLTYLDLTVDYNDNVDDAPWLQQIRSLSGWIGNHSRVAVVISPQGEFGGAYLFTSAFPGTLSSEGALALTIGPGASIRIYSDRRLASVVWRRRDGRGLRAVDIASSVDRYSHWIAETTCSRIDISHRRLTDVFEAICLAACHGLGASILFSTWEFSQYRNEWHTHGTTISHAFALKAPLRTWSSSDMLRLTSADGSVVLSRTGEVMDFGTYLFSPGGRHASARHAVETLPWVAAGIVVSQDGGATFVIMKK